MEIKLQKSFKDEIIGKALFEYINRKDSCGYHDVTMEQFASVASAVLQALESCEDILFPNINLDNVSICLRNNELEDLNEIDKRLNDIHNERVNYCKVYNNYESGLQIEYEELIALKRKCIEIGGYN